MALVGGRRSERAQVNEISCTTFVRISGLRGCLVMVRPQIKTACRRRSAYALVFDQSHPAS
jgi:hypothetical protein